MSKNLNLSLLIASLIITTLELPALTQEQGKTQNKLQFFCGQSYEPTTRKNLPTTFGQPPLGRKIAIVLWKSEWAKGLDSSARCQEVAKRFQSAYEKGILEYLTYGQSNNTPVICATRYYGGPCQQLILTLRQKENPIEVLNQLNDIVRGRSSSVLMQSSGGSQLYVRFDLKGFIDKNSSQNNNK